MGTIFSVWQALCAIATIGEFKLKIHRNENCVTKIFTNIFTSKFNKQKGTFILDFSQAYTLRIILAIKLFFYFHKYFAFSVLTFSFLSFIRFHIQV